MRRQLTRVAQVLIDLLVLSIALALAFWVRFDGAPPTDMIGRLLLTGPYVVVFEYFVLLAFGIHRFAWRYVGLREAVRVFVAMCVSTVGLMAARIVLGRLQFEVVYVRHGVIPFGVIAVNFAAGFLGVVGVRIARRLAGESIDTARRAAPGHAPQRTILIGSGRAGGLVARELQSRPDVGMKPIGFLDDDPTKVGSVIHGLPVLGTTADLGRIVAEKEPDQALITIASAPGREIRRIREACASVDLPTKIIPGLYEIVGGDVNLSRIRDVAIEDLLRRDPVVLDNDAIEAALRNRVVLVTGAGGSIGSEICRQISRFGPAALVLAERAENALFEIHRELQARFPNVVLLPCIADVGDASRVRELLSAHRPSVVLHAAAHKHVPMMEWNAGEAVKNNVLGTRILADLAHEFGVSEFVMISTDKAVNPTSVMGATKRVAEMYVQALSEQSKTRFVTVRFGNVLGSNGSVVPLFQEQIARGGPVMVTHEDMRRYFMTIPEACQLVLQAATMGKGGEIFILDMGEPVRIIELARDLINLSGLREGEDVEIRIVGLRPGEKLFEELSTDEECADKTRHPKVFVGRIAQRTLPDVESCIQELESAAASGDANRVRLALRRAVPEFQPHEDTEKREGANSSDSSAPSLTQAVGTA